MPSWLKWIIAFSGPALGAGIAVASTNGGQPTLLFWLTFFAAGIGGLAGMGANKTADKMAG